MGTETNLLPTIFYGALLLFLLGAIAALWFRMGTVMNHIGRVEGILEATQESVADKDRNRRKVAERADDRSANDSESKGGHHQDRSASILDL